MPDLPEHGIRALKISADGKLMATGDRRGNLRVLQIADWKEITYLEAHDSEILTIDFSTSASIRGESKQTDKASYLYTTLTHTHCRVTWIDCICKQR